MKIKSLASAPDRIYRYRVVFEDDSVMRLYRQTIQDFGLYAGLELPDETFAKLKEAASAMSAKMRAIRIVSASSVSKGDLQQRLIHKGEDPQQTPHTPNSTLTSISGEHNWPLWDNRLWLCLCVPPAPTYGASSREANVC